MNAVDSNVLVYYLDDDEPVKQAKAVSEAVRKGDRTLGFATRNRDLRPESRGPVPFSDSLSLLGRLSSDATPTVLLWQVVAELVRQLRAWQDQGEITQAELRGYVAHFRNAYPLIMPTPQVLDAALDLASRYSLSHGTA